MATRILGYGGWRDGFGDATVRPNCVIVESDPTTRTILYCDVRGSGNTTRHRLVLPHVIYVIGVVGHSGKFHWYGGMHIFGAKVPFQGDLNHQIYPLPLPNVYRQGMICAGMMRGVAADHPDQVAEGVIADYWGGHFTYFLEPFLGVYTMRDLVDPGFFSRLYPTMKLSEVVEI